MLRSRPQAVLYPYYYLCRSTTSLILDSRARRLFYSVFTYRLQHLGTVIQEAASSQDQDFKNSVSLNITYELRRHSGRISCRTAVLELQGTADPCQSTEKHYKSSRTSLTIRRCNSDGRGKKPHWTSCRIATFRLCNIHRYSRQPLKKTRVSK